MNNDQQDSGPRAWLNQLIMLLTRQPKDRQALIDLLRHSENRNLLDPDALAMIEGALVVSEMQVRDIMIPRVQMVCVKHNAAPEEILKIVVDSGHSRFPVFGDDADDVVGILLAKDLLYYYATSDDSGFNIKDLMRPVVFVPESKRLNILLREFRSSRNHMAIVVDEYSSVSGLVTIEDVIEEIVGDIEDEHDIDTEEHIKPYGRNRYTVSALTSISEFNTFFGKEYSDAEYDTVGGMILKSFGRVPKRGELLEFDGFNVKILRADKRRIHLMRFIKQEVQETDTPSEDRKE